MKCWIGLEGEAGGVFAFNVNEQFLVLGAEPVEQFGMNRDPEFVNIFLMTLHQGMQSALKFDAHGHGTLHNTLAVTVGTVRVERTGKTLLGALPCHFHQTESRDRQDMCPGLVAAEAVTHPLVDSLLILAILHVNEIHDNESADIPEAKLAGNLVGGLHVGLEEGLVHVLAPLVSTGIHINGDHGLGLVNNEVSSAWEPDLAQKGAVNLALDGEIVEDRLLPAVMVDGFFCPFGNLSNQNLHPLGCFDVVHMNGIHIFGKEIADGSLDEIRLKNKCAGGRFFNHALLHLAPLVKKEAEIANEKSGLLSLSRRADDDAHSIRQREFRENLAQAGAFLGILDFAGDSALVVEWHEHHVAAGHGNVGGDAGTFGANRPLGDLYHDFTANGIDGGNVLGGDFFL